MTSGTGHGAEIVLEGWIHPGETALRRPSTAITQGITMKQGPFRFFYYCGLRHGGIRIPLDLYRQAPDDPAMLGHGAERGVRARCSRASSPESRGLLPAAGRLLLRIACVSLASVPGACEARDVRHLELFLRQFMYTSSSSSPMPTSTCANWKRWSGRLTTRVDPRRDTLITRAHADRLPRLCEPGARLGPRWG